MHDIREGVMNSATSNQEWVMQQLVGHIDGLDREQAGKIARFSREKTFESRDAIFREEDSAVDLYLLLEGLVILTAEFPHAVGSIAFALLGPSEFFGWSAVVPPHQNSASAEVIRSAKVLAINGRKLLALCDREPETGYLVMRRLLGTVAGRLRATRSEIFSRLSPRVIKETP